MCCAHFVVLFFHGLVTFCSFVLFCVFLYSHEFSSPLCVSLLVLLVHVYVLVHSPSHISFEVGFSSDSVVLTFGVLCSARGSVMI